MVKTKLIVNRTRGGRALCVGEMADNPLRRMRGLLGRSALPAGEGMLLTPAPSIHTAFMRFSIDAVFLDSELRVIKIVEKLGPWRVAAKASARAVLELPAGETARCGVELGDHLELRERSRIALRNGGSPTGAAAQSSESPSRATLTAAVSASAPSGAGQSRLTPLRVLLISPDRHYRTAMSLLLTRRNCLVRAVSSGRSLSELLADEDVDVVLLDAGSSQTAMSIAALESLALSAAIVFVADEPRAASRAERVLPKWGPFDELISEVERVSAKTRTEVRNGKH